MTSGNWFGSVGVAFALVLPARAAAGTSDSDQVKAIADTFHAALAGGDCSKAMELLAPDAVIVEGGSMETRAEYESEHLFEDIAFAQAVRSERSVVAVQIEGNTAWLTSTSRVKGEFRGRTVDSEGAELMVLTKSPAGWRIRAIHWSSHAVKPAK